MNFLTLEDVIALHEKGILSYGGAQGIRDRSALESAIHRPQSGYYEDAIACAAALMESLAGNHPFVDGNKRVALASVYVMLRMNGYRIEADEQALYRQIIGLFEAGQFKFTEIEKILRAIAHQE